MSLLQMVEQLFQEETSENDPEDSVVVPEIHCPFSIQKLAVLHGLINPLTSPLDDRELYVQTIHIIERMCAI
ncbi:hypothetical protein DPEC_G00343330 [Dallia pectoralis]|uniref:Uncharacterized protein n=1 Tax=Dallia pectoralis TaxID=75939 RepID=A0ACC2F2Y7_DALPE|nr:hypothetical protein DPEC_G00343330 [Dallia pectoralis]